MGTKNPRGWLISSLVGLFAVCGAASNSQLDPRDLVQTAIASGQRRVVIPPGVYRMSPGAGTSTHLSIRNARNLEVIADGVTFVCTRRTRALQLDQCENLTLQGLTIDYDPLTFTQGRVIAVAQDKGWIDVKVDAGYPLILYTRIVVYDPKTRFQKRYVNHLWGTKSSWKEPGVIRVTRPKLAENIAAGDLISLSAGPEPGGADHAVVITNSANTTFRNVTVHCAPGMGIVEGAGEGGTRLLGCKIVRGPKPAGATEDRLLTTSWDAILHKQVRRGPRVEDCVIENAGDDSWSLGAADYLVLATHGDTVVVSPRDRGGAVLEAGDTLKRFRTGPEAAIREVRETDCAGAGLAADVLDKLRLATPYSVWRVSKRCVAATLDRQSPFQVGEPLYCPNRQGNGFVFRNNRIHSPGRGVLLKAAAEGIIENNLFWGGGKAVCIAPELTGDSHAACASHVIIRNNTIRETGYHNRIPDSPKTGAITLSATFASKKVRPAGAFDDIVIEGNRFEGVRGLNIGIISAKNVRIKGNRFIHTHSTEPGDNGSAYGMDAASVIWISESENIVIEDNEISGMGPFAKRALYLSPSAKGVTGMPSGIRVKN